MKWKIDSLITEVATMINLKLLRENPEFVKKDLEKRYEHEKILAGWRGSVPTLQEIQGVIRA